ncbi:hypothetical protein SOVF_177530 [Spinacia oleracea]|nr:hypothetical protein SOVF_177530 [Spinacia oleracea]
MGGCISTFPPNGSRNLRRKIRARTNGRSRRSRGVSEEYTTTAGRKSTNNSRLINVLSNPTVGDNIKQKYTFGKELGRGEFGVTYQCTEVATGENYACKTISKSKLRTEVDIEDVKREVEIMRHFPKHPNIVAFKEAYEDKEAVYLVMELCQGGELFDRIVSRGHYCERAASQVVRTILQVVKVCHAHGVIHRDLKPENFLFANKNENAALKAIDFGLSIFFEPETEEGIAQAIVRGVIDFERDPWPRVSPLAKDLVKHMLDQNPYSRMTVDEVLEHPWMKNANNNADVPLGQNVVADTLPDEQIEKLRKTFNMMDTDKNGSLSFEELKQGLVKLGHVLPDSDVQMILEAADVDGNGTLDCGEFLTLSIHLQKMGDDEHLLRAFKYFDKDQSGYIEFEELKLEFFSDVDATDGTKNEQVIRDILFDADLNKDGRIDYNEFKTMMHSGMDWKMCSRQYSKAMFNKLSTKLFNHSGLLK